MPSPKYVPVMILHWGVLIIGAARMFTIVIVVMVRGRIYHINVSTTSSELVDPPAGFVNTRSLPFR